MGRSASDLEGVDHEAAPFLRSIDTSLESAAARAGGSPVTVPANALAMGVFGPDAGPRGHDERFAEWFDPLEIGEAARDWLRGDGAPALTPVRVRSGATTVVLLAKIAVAKTWTLPEPLRPTLDEGGGDSVALASRPLEDRDLQ